jgi:crossover junction endodeoxyribonuclease RuvC
VAKQPKKSKILEQSISQATPKAKRILGLDLSLTGTGYCIIEEGAVSAGQAEYGIINTNNLHDSERMDFILEQVKARVTNDTFVVIEDFSFGSKGSGLSEIHGLGWIIRHYLWKNKIEFTLIPPTVLKKFATGKGNSDKNIILKEIYKLWNVDLYNDNEADAFVLSMIGRAFMHLDDANLKSFQKEVITKLCHDSKI